MLGKRGEGRADVGRAIIVRRDKGYELNLLNGMQCTAVRKGMAENNLC